jgi:ferredoxin
MIPRILDKDKLDEFVSMLLKNQRVVGPVLKEPQWDQSSDKVTPTGLYQFAEVTKPEQLAVPFPHTILPPKKFAYPQFETLLNFGADGAEPAAVDIKPTVIFDAHPCDIKGLMTSDMTMGSENTDEYYTKRRAMLTVIGLDCAKPCDEYQFCRDMGSLPCTEGYDLFLTDMGDRYYVEVGTEKGKTLVEECMCFRPAGGTDHHEKQAYDKKQDQAFNRKIPCDVRYLPELLDASYDSLIWEAASRNCFSCGACTNVCPTCYCFDVKDDVNLDGSGGSRNRNWDSCMLRQFAVVADGHNFRATKGERLRHRVMRKGKYILEKFGKTGCTGCGRCDRHCVANISILRIYQMISEGVAAAK